MMVWVQYIVRVILAGLFIYAGTIKFLQPDIFLSDIESYRMMPYAVAWLVTFYLPPLEILCGLGLLLPKFRKHSAYLLLLLMIVFIIAISVAWARGLNISCGCFGTSDDEANYIWLIVRDLLLAGALAFLLRARRQEGVSPHAPAKERRPASGHATGAAGVTTSTGLRDSIE